MTNQELAKLCETIFGKGPEYERILDTADALRALVAANPLGQSSPQPTPAVKRTAPKDPSKVDRRFNPSPAHVAKLRGNAAKAQEAARAKGRQTALRIADALRKGPTTKHALARRAGMAPSTVVHTITKHSDLFEFDPNGLVRVRSTP